MCTLHFLLPTTIMERVGFEKISQSPLTFESVFSISPTSFSAMKHLLIPSIRSEKCGLGWTFCIAPASNVTVSLPNFLDFLALHETSSAILCIDLEPTTIALSGNFTFDRVACRVSDALTRQTSPSLRKMFEYAVGHITTITVSGIGRILP